jgi:hypothetical protein
MIELFFYWTQLLDKARISHIPENPPVEAPVAGAKFTNESVDRVRREYD